MQYRIVPAVTAPLLLAIASFSRPSPVLAQAASASRLTSAATRLGATVKRTFAVRVEQLNRPLRQAGAHATS